MSTPSQASPRRLRVFLCHASADKQAVRELYQRLRDCNVAPWLDEENLLPGQDWEREIRKAVRETDVVMVCLSRQSITKAGFVQKEIKFALDVADEQPEGTIFIIPIRLEECEVPERLRRWHWFSYYEGKGYDRLMNALKERSMSLNQQIIPIDCQPNHHSVPSPPPLRNSFTSKQTGTSGQVSSLLPPQDKIHTINRKKILTPLIALVVIATLIGGVFLLKSIYVSGSSPQLTPTATTSLSATNPYGGTLVLDDPLHDNSKGNGWDVYSNSTISCKFTGGAYHAIRLDTNNINGCNASPDFSNFAFQVQMTIIKGGPGGIAFRVHITPNDACKLRLSSRRNSGLKTGT